MTWATRFAARLQGLFQRSRSERELDDELRFHLEMQMEDNRKAGMDPVEARFAAMRSFGGADPMKEAYREARSFPAIEILAQDVRYAIRTLRNNAGFTAAAVLSLTLGIGANTAIFTLIDAVLLRQLPVRDPLQLVQLTAPQGTQRPMETFSYPLVHALADHREIFSGLAGFSPVTFRAGPPDAVEPVPGAWVTGEYYQTLGLEPVIGRLLSPDDDRPGAEPAAVIADGYWARRFGRDPAIVGRSIRIESASVVVVGVSPPGFTGVDVGQIADLTVAGGALPQILPDNGAYWIRSNYCMLRVIARPRAGLSRDQASAHLAAIWPGLIESSPFRKGLMSGPELRSAATGWTDLRRQFRLPLLVLMAVVAMVLLIACANVANLSLARASARQREIAVRLAIGASRARIIRQLLTESLLLSFCGAALGLGLACFGSRFVVDLISSGPAGAIVLDLAPHRQILLFATLAAVGTAMLFGIAPALRATGPGPAMALKNSPAHFSNPRTRLAPALVVFQVALSLLLLIGAGLFLGTLRNLRHFDAGFSREGVLLVDVNERKAGYDGPRLTSFYRESLDKIGRLRGVASVSLSNATIFSGGSVGYGVRVTGTSAAPVNVDFHRIGPRYFETLRTPILEGREFTLRDDRSAPQVAIINEALAHQFFPGGHPVGQYLSIEGIAAPAEIIGVAKDVRSQSLREAAAAAVYVPFFQRNETLTATFEVYATGSLSEVASELRRELQPATGAIEIRPLSARVERTLVQERLVATLAGSFGALALILAGIGLYGLLAYTVTRRTREIGIRMALGAERAEVLRMVIRQALQLLAGGIALGLPAAWLASRWVASLLFGLTPADPQTSLAATAVLGACGLVAGFLPALRASRVDPSLALRYE